MIDEIIKFKCIKDFYLPFILHNKQKAFTKDKIYIAKKYIDTNEYLLINDLSEKHWISPDIDGMDTYFIKVK
jgi:hypothetical protein